MLLSILGGTYGNFFLVCGFLVLFGPKSDPPLRICGKSRSITCPSQLLFPATWLGISQKGSKSFLSLFQPPEAENDHDTENTKNPDLKKDFFVFYDFGPFLASGGQKSQKTGLRNFQNNAFVAFAATRGWKWPWHTKQKRTRFIKGFFCRLWLWAIFGPQLTSQESPKSKNMNFDQVWASWGHLSPSNANF